MSTELKIKTKTLATEATYIRREERAAIKMARAAKEFQDRKQAAKSYKKYNNLRDHRTRVVRPEARATGLARGFLNGRPYREIEASTRDDNEPNWSAVDRMVSKYSTIPSEKVMGRLKAWSRVAATTS